VARGPEPLVFLDTHVVAWLYDALVGKLSESARSTIERSAALTVSPMVRLELQYLYEIGRLRVPPADILDGLRQSIGLKESNPSMTAVIRAALGIKWTRDTFDRLIVAEAAATDADLVTKEVRIREYYDRAVW